MNYICLSVATETKISAAFSILACNI